MKTLLACCLLFTLIVGSLNAVSGQQSGSVGVAPACNNQSRTLQIAAGTSQTEQQCAQWSITVLGVTFTSPSACPNSKTVRSDDTFSCGPAATGIHCNPRGYKVNVKVYSSNNPCPGIPSTLPTTLEEANAAVQCQPLALISDVNTWSASVQACATGTQIREVDRINESELSNLVVTGGDNFVFYSGNPAKVLAKQPPSIKQTAEQLNAMQTRALESLPQALAQSYLLHPRVEGIKKLRATVEYNFRSVGNLGVVRNVHQLEGAFTHDGRFSITDTRSGTLEDNDSQIIVEDMAYDGSNFFSGIRGQHRYNAYAPSSAGIKSAICYDAQFMKPLVSWATSPFWITLFPQTEYAMESVGDNLVKIIESYPQMQIPGGAGKTVYYISTAPVAHPIRIETFDAGGQLRIRKDFSEFVTIGKGIWRPLTVVESFYQPGEATPYLTTSMKIDQAIATSAKDAERAFARVRSPENLWRLFMK
ncbi:MAG: hypothetical protein AB1757_26495 [Acidobacteriota bacterium]